MNKLKISLLLILAFSSFAKANECKEIFSQDKKVDELEKELKEAPEDNLHLRDDLEQELKKIQEENLDLKDELEQKTKEAEENILDLKDETENLRKRSIKEKEEISFHGNAKLITALADRVLDDWDRAIDFAEKDQSFDNLKEGLDAIQKNISQVLKDFEVEVVDPTGEIFDPHSQEALGHMETSEFPEGHVAQTVRKGYKLHGKVIRPAQVILAKKKEN